MNTTATAVATALNANLADIELVLDMADSLMEIGELTEARRPVFVHFATFKLRERVVDVDRQIGKNLLPRAPRR